MIPKIFHLTSKSKDLPARFRKNIDRIRSLYPDHEIRIHDDEDIRVFLESRYPDYWRHTLSKAPSFIMVVDTVRYMWMEEFGGIYCDMDIFFNRRFEFKDGVVLVEREWTWPPDPSITQSIHNCVFASVAGHPIWDDFLGAIAENLDALQRNGVPKVPESRAEKIVERTLVKLGLREEYYPPVFNVSGPNALSRALTRQHLPDKYDDVLVLPGSAIWQAGLSKGSAEDAIFVHETTGSWNA